MICFQLGAGVAVALALQVQPHDCSRPSRSSGFTAVVRILLSISRGMLLVAIRMSQTIGLGAAAEAFDLGVERRDLGDALHDRRAGRRVLCIS